MFRVIILTLALAVALAACSQPAQPAATGPTSLPAAPTLAPIAPTLVPTAVPPTSAPTLAPTAQPTVAPTAVLDLATRIDTFINRLMKQGVFSGVVFVAKKSEVLFAQAYGLADRERGTPNTLATRFQIASITKQFTAAAILMLQAEGKLNVKDKACAYIKPCPEAWAEVTIHQMLTHTAGMPLYFPDETRPATAEDLLASFRDKPLIFAPGDHFEYSNSGYVVLGAIIEQVSGQPYGDFLQARIFTPLGMADTGYNRPEGAIGYMGQAPAPATNLTVAFSAGGLSSTAEDLYRWSQALDDDTLLPADLRALMFTSYIQLPAPYEVQSYGYGWFIRSQEGALRQEHGGSIYGYRSEIMRFPERGITIILLCNREEPSDALLTAEPIAKWALAEP
jgi:CubicO group peptidase (beta-lactamase class C family)